MSIFDLLGLCARISKHPDHYACATYYGCNDQWVIMIHKTGSSDIIYDAHITENEPRDGWDETCIESAYSELKEYLP